LDVSTICGWWLGQTTWAGDVPAGSSAERNVIFFFLTRNHTMFWEEMVPPVNSTCANRLGTSCGDPYNEGFEGSHTVQNS
jgi:hypothetical protein